MSKKLFKRQLSDDGYSIMVTRENPRLTRDRPISLFSSQARTKIQSPSKNFDWLYYFATTNHLQHQLTTIILCKGQIMEICFSFIISTPCFVFGALWALRWGLRKDWSDWESFGIPRPPTAPPRLSLENLDPSKIHPCHPLDPFIQS